MKKIVLQLSILVYDVLASNKQITACASNTIFTKRETIKLDSSLFVVILAMKYWQSVLYSFI